MQLFHDLNSLLQESVAKHASNIAIEDVAGQKLTYAELDKAAEGIKTTLSHQRAMAGTRIGILASKNSDYVKAIFGILKSNAAYVPMDLKAPMSRNMAIFEDCELQAIFIESTVLENFKKALEPQHTYIEIPVSTTMCLLVFEQEKQISAEQVAYIIYTSGPTGVPKGVVHTHSSALAFINWSMDTFKPGSQDQFASHAPFHFDLSIFDLFVSVGVGGTLLLIDEKTAANPLMLSELLAQKKINTFYATPSTLSYLTMYGKMHKYDFTSLELVLFAGEVFPIDQLRSLKTILPHTTFYNLYGPTETNVCTCFKIPAEIPPLQNQPFPIGIPCTFAEAKTNNDSELLISGTSLMTGYWNDPGKTTQAFEKDDTGRLWYRTGDLAKKNEDGQYLYMGRKDRMVKRKGYRIELGEIEHRLLQHKNIVQVALTAIPKHDLADTLITAHIAWSDKEKPSTIDMVNYCSTVLPVYMIPDHFKFYEYLPHTSTNKIDYKALTLLND